MKREIRVIGIDDSPFDKRKKIPVLVVGTVFRGGCWIDGVVSTQVEQDGDDATEKIADMIMESKFSSQIRVILLNGITVAGFNIVDINELARRTKKAVIVVVRDMPDIESVFTALRKMKQEYKIEIIKQFPSLQKIDHIHIQHIGYTLEQAKELLKIVCTRAYVPEPLRVAHLIAAGIVKGESRGRA